MVAGWCRLDSVHLLSGGSERWGRCRLVTCTLLGPEGPGPDRGFASDFQEWVFGHGAGTSDLVSSRQWRGSMKVPTVC